MLLIKLMPSLESILELIDRKTWLMVLFLSIIFCTGCASLFGPSEGEIDRSFITDEPCQAPCWYGLWPGVSTEEEFLDKLGELEFIDRDSIRINETTRSPQNENLHSIDFNCVYPEGDQCGSATISDGKIHSLLLFVHYDLTLVEFVDMLGFPDYLDYYPPHPEIPGVNIDFIWTEKNISTSAHLIRIDQTEALQANIGLPRTLPIMWILYAVSDRFDLPPSGVRIQWPGYAD